MKQPFNRVAFTTASETWLNPYWWERILLLPFSKSTITYEISNTKDSAIYTLVYKQYKKRKYLYSIKQTGVTTK